MHAAVDRKDATDTELMLAYRDGDELSFNELYARHRTSLYRFILNSCANEATAAETFQDVWAKVSQARLGYTDNAPFKAWLYRIARNNLVDGYRASNANPLQHADELNEDTQVSSIQTPLQPDEVAQLNTNTSTLTQALNTLPPTQREVILLRHIAGFTLNEIAEQLNENTETVKSRLRYAFTKLRKQVRLQL